MARHTNKPQRVGLQVGRQRRAETSYLSAAVAIGQQTDGLTARGDGAGGISPRKTLVVNYLRVLKMRRSAPHPFNPHQAYPSRAERKRMMHTTRIRLTPCQTHIRTEWGGPGMGGSVAGIVGTWGTWGERGENAGRTRGSEGSGETGKFF